MELPSAEGFHLLQIEKLFPKQLLLSDELLHVEDLVFHYSFVLLVHRALLGPDHVTVDADRVTTIFWRASLVLQLSQSAFHGFLLGNCCPLMYLL